MRQAETATRKGAGGRIQVFEYPAGPHAPELPDWCALSEGEEDEAQGADLVAGAVSAAEARQRAELDQRLKEEARRSYEAGREKGIQEGRQAERQAAAAAQAAAEQQRMRQALDLMEEFGEERERYFQSVEHEVVKLALAVAARILRREAQMDPLLLTGAVRVALGQLSGSTQVRLRVPAAELDLWTEAMALVPNLAVRPQVVAGEKMLLGDCVIETDLGTVDLGIRSQLAEIERGFFDRAGGSLRRVAGGDEAGQEAAQPVGASRESRG